jgi:MFS family permease
MVPDRWRVLIGSSLSLSFSIGTLLVYSFSLFVKPLTTEFGWSRGEVSLATSLANVAVSITAPILGMLCDRFGSRVMIFLGHSVLCAGLLSLAFLTPHLWHFYALFLLLGLFASGSSPLPYARLISMWFEKDRGLALGVMMAGIGLGSFIIPFMAQHAIAGAGWRSAYFTLGLLAVLIPVPLNALLIRERRVLTGNSSAVAGLTRSEALRTRAWWQMTSVFLLLAICANGVISHLAAILTDAGLDGADAALSLSIFGISALAGRVITGWLVDRFFAPYVAALLFGGLLVGIALLRIGTGGPIAACLTGIALGAELDVMPYLVSRYFGMRAFGAIYGTCFGAFTLGMATGPLLMGYGFDLTHSYRSPLSVLLVLLGAAVVVTAMLPKYHTVTAARSQRTFAVVHQPEAAGPTSRLT